jgi:tRNA G18 (ribose-2'-O)-methylase SpoU
MSIESNGDAIGVSVDNEPTGLSSTQQPGNSWATSLRTHLVIANIQKRNNVQNLLSTAIAFGVGSILIVGQPSLDLDPNSPKAKMPLRLRQALILHDGDADEYDNHIDVTRGTARVLRFAKWNDCVSYLERNNIPLVGVEIDKQAITIDEFLTKCREFQHVALVMGNEANGLSTSQMKSCRHLLRLPQYGAGTASFNVYVAASLVLQRLHQRETTGR